MLWFSNSKQFQMRTWSLIIVLLFLSVCLKAQSLSSVVSSDSILLGNYFIYEIKLENIDEQIDFPFLDEFQIISGPNTSSSFSIVNGKQSSSKTYTWYLKPLDLGQYFIEPIALNKDGEIFEAEPLEINVYPNPDGIIVEPQKNTMDDFFNLQRPNLFGERIPAAPEEKSKPKRELKKG